MKFTLKYVTQQFISKFNLYKNMRWLDRVSFQLFIISIYAFNNQVAQAQPYPEKSRQVRIIVPTGAGSAIDLIARTYSKALAETSGISSVVDNKPGADGAIGIQTFLATQPDGYNLLLLSSSFAVINPIINQKLPYDPLKDFVPLTTTSQAGIVMSVSTSFPFTTLREFVASARANPSKYTCAVSSPTLRLACEHLQASAGIKILIVPYKTTATAMIAVATRETDVIFADTGSFVNLWQAGRLKGLVYATTERHSAYPNIPTTKEEGFPDFLMSAWYGFYFKPGTPYAIEEIMRDRLRKAGMSQTVKDSLKNFVHEPLDLAGPDMLAMTKREIENWNRLVNERGIKFTD